MGGGLSFLSSFFFFHVKSHVYVITAVCRTAEIFVFLSLPFIQEVGQVGNVHSSRTLIKILKIVLFFVTRLKKTKDNTSKNMNVCHLNCMCMFLRFFFYTSILKSYIEIIIRVSKDTISSHFFILEDQTSKHFPRASDDQYTKFISG